MSLKLHQIQTLNPPFIHSEETNKSQIKYIFTPQKIQSQSTQTNTKNFSLSNKILVILLITLSTTVLIYINRNTIFQLNTIDYSTSKSSYNLHHQQTQYPSKNLPRLLSHYQEDTVDDIADGVKSGVSRVANKAGDVASGLWRGAKNLGREAVETTGDAASSTLQGIKDVGRTITGSRRGDYDRQHKGLFGAVRGAGRGIYSGVSSVGRGTRRVASGVWRGAQRVTRAILF